MVGMTRGPVKRAWGSFTTTAPFTQSYPGGTEEGEGGFVRTRTQPGIGGALVPVHSGNGIRARLHRAMAEDLFTRVGIDLVKKEMRPAVAQLMLVGGVLPKDGLRALTIETERELRSLIPQLALMGGTVLSTFLTGRLRLGDFVALTKETPEPYLRAAGVKREDLPEAEKILFVEYHVRGGQDLSEYWSEDEIAADGLDGGGKSASRTMPYGTQGVIAGVQFVGSVALGNYRGLSPEDDAVQRSCLRYYLETTFPDGAGGDEVVLGLGAAHGRGCVEFSWGDALEAISDEDEVGETYFAHIEAHREELHKRLTSDELVPKLKPKQDKGKGGRKAVAATDAADDDADDDADGDEEAVA